MNTNMVLDFMQNRQPLGLAQIGQLGGQRMQQRRANKQREVMEQAYSDALDLVLQDPTEENVARFYQVAQPLGRFDEARDAVNDYFERQHLNAQFELDSTVAATEDVVGNPAMDVYMAAFEAWRRDKLNVELQDNLIGASQAEGVDKYSEAQEMVSGAIQNRDTAIDEAAYDAALTDYDHTGSAESRLAVNSAASRLGWAGTANQTLDSIEANRSEANKARILGEQRSALFAAQDRFALSPTQENFRLMTQAAQPLDEYQNMLDYSNKLDSDEIEANVDNAASILAPLSVNDIDGTTEAIDRLKVAFSDDPEQLAALQDIQDQVDEGDLVGAREYLYTLLSTTDQGREYVGKLLDLNEDRRKEDITASQLLLAADKLEFDTEEQKSAFIESAGELPYGIVNSIVEMSRVAVPDAAQAGEARDRLLDREENLRREYMGYIENHLVIRDQLANLESLFAVDATGMQDQAFITLFNKVLDPDSVVRESEAARTVAAAGLFRNIDDKVLGMIRRGETLDEAAKADILAASRAIYEEAEKTITTRRAQIQKTIDVIDPDSLYGSTGRVFDETENVRNVREAFNARVDHYLTEGGFASEEMFRKQMRQRGIFTIEELDAAMRADGFEDLVPKNEPDLGLFEGDERREF